MNKMLSHGFVADDESWLVRLHTDMPRGVCLCRDVCVCVKSFGKVNLVVNSK